MRTQSAQLSQTPSPAPTPAKARVASLDVLRGLAVLGILPLLTQVLAESWSASFNPAAGGQLSGQSGIIWIITHILFSQKFITILSVLFGAGIALLAARTGTHDTATHLRRMGSLLAIGLGLIVFFWPSGLLVLFSLGGFIAFQLKKWPAQRLFIRSVLCITLGSVCLLGASMTGEVLNMGIVHWRFTDVSLSVFVLSSFTLRTFGLLLAGMALLKWGALHAAWPSSRYVMIMTIAAFVGFPLTIFGILKNVSHGWDMTYAMGIGAQFNYWGSLLVAGGYASFILLICKYAAWKRIQTILAATGRMAFSNYFIQISIYTWLFHDPGPSRHVDRLEQLAIAGMIALTVMVFSSIWLRYFRFGPVEWVWAWVTYAKRPAFIYMHRVFAPYHRP